MTFRNARLFTIALAAAVALKANASFAQSSPGPTPRSEFETRAELEEQARVAEAEHRTGEAWLLRTRLKKGDFQEGDRIVVIMHSLAFKIDAETLVVRTGKVLQLPRMGEMQLEGVLRSELTDRFVKHLAKYLQDPEAKTIPLLRIGVQGSVGRPGYYYVSPDLVLNDVIMRAGGPGGDADLKKVTIHRGSDVIWDENGTQAALIDGLSLDRLHMRAGDDVMIPTQHHFPWTTILTVGLSIVSIAVTIVRFR